MASRPIQFQHREPPTTQSPQARIRNDLDYRDTLFVYPVVLVKNSFNEDTEEWADKPLPIRCSFQEHAVDSQKVQPDANPNRFSNIFTRYRDFVNYRDKVVCRGISMVIIKVLEHMDNVTGEFHHTELRARFLSENESVPRE